MGLKKCGGAWIKSGKKGEFLSVSFEPEGKGGPKYSFMLFKEEYDEEHPQGKRPDYSCVMSDGEDDRKPADFQASDEDVPF